MTTEVVIIALALTALAANLLAPSASRWQQSHRARRGADSLASRSSPCSGPACRWDSALSTLPVAAGHRAAPAGNLRRLAPLPDGQPYTVGWLYVAAMLITAVACRIGAHLYRHAVPWLSATYIFGTAAATLVGVAGLLSRLRHQELGQPGTGADDHPDPLCDRGAALSRTRPGKPLGLGRPDRHGRDARGRPGGRRGT